MVTSKTTKQEIRKLLKERASSIVDERIAAETIDNVDIWAGELIRKLTTINIENALLIEQAYELFWEGLMQETIKQLKTSTIKSKSGSKK